jgi:hypothetical protein
MSKDFLINHKSQQYKPFCTPCKKVFLVAAEHVYTHVYTSPGNKVGFKLENLSSRAPAAKVSYTILL